MTDDIPEMTARDFAHAIHSTVLQRIREGRIEKGSDVAALRRYVWLSQTKFARAMGVSVAVLREWESGAVAPTGPALALLRVVAWHPRVLRSSLAAASRGQARRSARTRR